MSPETSQLPSSEEDSFLEFVSKAAALVCYMLEAVTRPSPPVEANTGTRERPLRISSLHPGLLTRIQECIDRRR